MKVRVSKRELYETIEGAVRKALNESIQAPNGKKMHGAGKKKEKYPNKWDDEDGNINEWADYDDDEDDVLNRFLKDKKNQIPKRMKGGGAARKAAMADIKAELDAEKKDDDAIDRAEKDDRPQED